MAESVLNGGSGTSPKYLSIRSTYSADGTELPSRPRDACRDDNLGQLRRMLQVRLEVEERDKERNWGGGIERKGGQIVMHSVFGK